MNKLNPEHVQAVMEMINKGPYFKLLSMPVTGMGVGYSMIEINIEEKHLNPFGGVHGGVYASAIDTAAYWSVYCDLEEDVGLISLDLKIDCLAPIQTGKLVVNGRRLKAGRTICLAEGSIVDKNGKWLAHGTSKMMVTRGLQTIGEVIRKIDGCQPPRKFI